MLAVSPETALRNRLRARLRFRTFLFQGNSVEALKGRNSETSACPLLADAELADHGLIALGIVFLEVVEQATALADQHEKSAARAVVFLVRLEVLRQLANPFAQQRDLDFWASRVACVGSVLVDEGFLLLSG